MENWLRKLVQIEIILVFLVVIAGSVVRMTGSGMGCPDWPKCFGYLIPPTERAQLEWQADREFKKGQIIIVDEALMVSKSDFTSEDQYESSNWEAYTKHDYAQFNVMHTWTEYINRLCGALAGIPMLMLFVFSGLMIRKNWKYFALSALGLFLLGFEAWLGKLVVDGNLIPGSITIHMLGTYIIIAVLLILKGLLERNNAVKYEYDSKFNLILFISILFTVGQVVLGTQVREQIDHLNESGFLRSTWIENLDISFYIHRSFSILVVVINFWLWRTNKKTKLGFDKAFNWVLILIGLEVLLGIILSYIDMPAWAQPSHLLLATILFTVQTNALLKLNLSRNPKAEVSH